MRRALQFGMDFGGTMCKDNSSDCHRDNTPVSPSYTLEDCDDVSELTSFSLGCVSWKHMFRVASLCLCVANGISNPRCAFVSEHKGLKTIVLYSDTIRSRLSHAATKTSMSCGDQAKLSHRRMCCATAKLPATTIWLARFDNTLKKHL